MRFRILGLSLAAAGIALAAIAAFAPHAAARTVPAGTVTRRAAGDDAWTGLKLWSTLPADKWENAYPVGNGRLGAMVFGKTDVEHVQLNEDTYWSGGPYSTVVRGGAKVLPEIQRLVFEGNYKM
ncbi:MAG: glycoside hydrolase N-terminal domain-containing protein, partial [Candidatus Aminicenantales bacterium]